MKTCRLEGCDKSVANRGINAEYCSENCRAKNNVIRSRNRYAKKKPDRYCKTCSIELSVRAPHNAVYCFDCGQRARGSKKLNPTGIRIGFWQEIVWAGNEKEVKIVHLKRQNEAITS